jgi:hypothetical protein
VYIGEDFATLESELRAWIRDFVEARQNGDAERFLAPSGRDDYFETSGRTEPRLGEIYLHPERDIEDFRVDGFATLQPNTWTFDLRLVWEGPCPSYAFERITIEVVGDGLYELKSASVAGALVSDCLAT